MHDPTTMHDPINPSHYTSGTIECIEAMEASMSTEAFKGFLKGNCQKYLWRYEKKNGAEDLRKAMWYLDRLIGTVEAEQSAIEQAFGAMECKDGFCPLPGAGVRQGPPEGYFPPVS
jgi:hypothetical protein